MIRLFQHIWIATAVVTTVILTSCQPKVKSTLIQQVLLVDGTGSKPITTSIRIADSVIMDIGDLDPKKGEVIIDGSGLVLSPGFIDTHSHHDWDTIRTVEAAISQGITTIVVGQDGGMQHPLTVYFDSLDRYPLSVNIASYAGHNQIRRLVLGDDFEREATVEELEEMTALLESAMRSGALGLSTGLEYIPGKFSNTEEVVTLARTAAQYGGRYISHIRSEDMYLNEAIDEILTIGQQVGIPVQISHFKIIGKSIWGTAEFMLQKLDSARNAGIEVTADVYPYEYWQSTMTVLFPDRNFRERQAAEFALSEFTKPEWVIISRFNANPDYEGKLLSEIAKERGEDPASTLIGLIKMSEEIPGESVIVKSMIDEDIRTFLQWPHTNVCSDGAPVGHPRGWGAFPRYFNMMRDIPIEERIRKMTQLSAEHVGLDELGVIEVGAPADLVLFDADKLKDKATFEQSSQASDGILKVWVNGKIVYDENGPTGKIPGKVLRRKR